MSINSKKSKNLIQFCINFLYNIKMMKSSVLINTTCILISKKLNYRFTHRKLKEREI